MNNTLENALKETWEKKDKFYEENKDLSVLEILIKLENKYGVRGTSHNRSVYVRQLSLATPLKRLGLRNG
ncbi:MAG: hypothetical protein LBF83_09590 [Spirochaetaceae bacterium]|jgi:hypothetical protein|nr:hypothetical protein [Spirochaetaceae bacterium]